ncbi:MAG TPA: nitrile hydratase subunit alpha [Stellaceae bacterium]|nr:nitrile hydratase subunit alpha [Stellaceae bacterium]
MRHYDDMRSHHDMGGLPAGPVDRNEHVLAIWEKRVDALAALLSERGLRRVDEARRQIEALAPNAYDAMSYYERWMAAIGNGLLARGVLTADEIAHAMGAVEARLLAERHEHEHDGHDHAHDHDHLPHPKQPDEEDAPLAYYQVMEVAVRELLIAKGIISPADIRRMLERMDGRVPENGARVVAKAWTDPAYKARLLKDGAAACRELGIDMGETHLVVLENRPDLHNVVVCTLCSCYPRMVLGLPPDWYKSRAYRSRVVREPRKVLTEFGTNIPDSVAVRVHDSTADMRYLVLPERPKGTEGWSEERLAALVNRDSMIGVSRANEPA